VQTTKILERLRKEALVNVSIRVEATPDNEGSWSRAAASSKWSSSSRR
jgi:predicted membrane GTPase involved in stress response